MKLKSLLYSARTLTAAFAILLTGCITYPAHAQPVRVDSSGHVVYPTNFWSAEATKYLSELQALGVKTNAASASANGWLSSNDWSTFNAKQAALGYTPPTNSLAGIVAALGYTPPTNTLAGIVAALGYTPPTNTLAGIIAALGYTPPTNTLAGIIAALGYTPQASSTILSNLAVTGAFTNKLSPSTGIIFTTNNTTGEISISASAGLGGAADSINPSAQLNGTWVPTGTAHYFLTGTTNVNGNVGMTLRDLLLLDGTGLHIGSGLGIYASTGAISGTLTVGGIGGTGVLPEVGLSLSDNLTGNASSVKHGFLPKLPADKVQMLTGLGTWVTNNVNTFKQAADLATTGALVDGVGALYSAGYPSFVLALTNGALSIDGTAVAVDQRILLKDETTSRFNGIYYVALTGSSTNGFLLYRSDDARVDAQLKPGSLVYVVGGTANGNTYWRLDAGSSMASTMSFTQETMGGGSGVSVAAGTLTTASTNTGVVTINAKPQTNGFADAWFAIDPTTKLGTNGAAAYVRGTLTNDVNAATVTAGTGSFGTNNTDTLIVGTIDMPTNTFSGTSFILTTNTTITTSSDVNFTGAVIGVPTSTMRIGQMFIKASGNLNVTNPAAWHASDFATTRVLTNGNIMTLMLTVQPGLFTNLTLIQQ